MLSIKIKNTCGWQLCLEKREDGSNICKLENPWGIPVAKDFNIHISPFVIDRVAKKHSSYELENFNEFDLVYNVAAPLSRRPNEYCLELNGYNFIVQEFNGSLRVVFINTGLMGGIHWGGFIASCAQLTAGIVISVVGAVIPPLSVTGSAIIGSAIDSGVYAFKADNKKPFKKEEYGKAMGKGAAAGAAAGLIVCLAPGGALIGAIGRAGGRVTSQVGIKVIEKVTSGVGAKIIEQAVTGSVANCASAFTRDAVEVMFNKDKKNIDLKKVGISFIAGGIAVPVAGQLGSCLGKVTDAVDGVVTKAVVRVTSKCAEGATRNVTKKLIQDAAELKKPSLADLAQASVIGAVVSGATQVAKEGVSTYQSIDADSKQISKEDIKSIKDFVRTQGIKSYGSAAKSSVLSGKDVGTEESLEPNVDIVTDERKTSAKTKKRTENSSYFELRARIQEEKDRAARMLTEIEETKKLIVTSYKTACKTQDTTAEGWTVVQRRRRRIAASK